MKLFCTVFKNIDMLETIRYGLQESNTCIICDQVVETMDHIILSREVWASCLRRFRFHDRVLVHESDIMMWWPDSRRGLPKSVHHSFDSFVLPCWLDVVEKKEIQEPLMGRQGQCRTCSKFTPN